MIWLYSFTIFWGSALLFLIQPMVARMLLPRLGGAPAVWNTCTVFFQAALLLGYAYAHVSTQKLGVKRQMVLHMALMFLPFLVFPLGLSSDQYPRQGEQPLVWLFVTLMASVALPFWVVSSGSPVVQKWFASTNQVEARDPYFLYVASNLGSMSSLLAYPFVVEPWIGVAMQGKLWSIGYAIWLVLVGCCMVVTRKYGGSLGADYHSHDAPSAAGEHLDWGRIGFWVLLSFVPSSLMLGVTTHVTSEIASVPLFWVMPLALYLLTFILAFARRPWFPVDRLQRMMPIAAVSLAILMIVPLPITAIPLHLLGFTFIALACHSRLAADRPGPARLTAFYLWMSVGGVLGGALNALLAPVIFPGTWEYPLILVLSCLILIPKAKANASIKEGSPDNETPSRRATIVTLLLPVAIALLIPLLATMLATNASGLGINRPLGQFIALLCGAGLCLACMGRPAVFAAGVLAIVIGGNFALDEPGELLFQERSFFGVHRVRVQGNNGFHVLFHGSTIHGLQDPNEPCQALSYYHPSGPMGDMMQSILGTKDLTQGQGQGQGQDQVRMGVVGLGAGAIAAYSRPGLEMLFFEIDPVVIKISMDPKLFTFLTKCYDKPKTFYEGDARLRLREVDDHQFRILFLDAFSSDAVPTHLLSKEAVGEYLKKLDDQGILIFNISNRYLNLEPVFARIAQELGLTGYVRRDRKLEGFPGKTASEYIILARDVKHLNGLPQLPNWKPIEAGDNAPLWTDDYTNLLQILRLGRQRRS